MVGRIALVIAYGPEARAFLQSGLASRLSAQWDVMLVTAHPSSRAFEGCSEPVLPLPCESESEQMLRLRAWCRGARRRAPTMARAALAVERVAGRWLGGGDWARFLAERSIDAVVAASAAGGRTLPALQAAANLGLPAAVLLNSWKDLAKRADLPSKVAALGVTTHDELASVPSSAGRAAVCGLLHHAAIRGAPWMSRRDFCAGLGLDATRPLLCYAAGAAEPDEPALVERLARSLAGLPQAPQLIIRTNPMCEDLASHEAVARLPGVAVLAPRWELSRERDWNCPLPADLPWWRGALEHCAVALTRPSTVTLDFAAWGKPAVNLVWGPGEPPWTAPSFAPIRALPATLAAASERHVASLVEGLLARPPQLPFDETDPVERAFTLLNRAFGGDAEQSRLAPAAMEAAQ